MRKRITFLTASAMVMAAILVATPGLLQETHAATNADAAAIVAQQQPGGAQPNTEPAGPAATTAGEIALPGTTYWAVIRRDGGSSRSRGRAGGGKLATGQYEALFLDNIRNCAYTATIGDFDAVGTETTGEITVVGRVTDVRGVFITTHDSAGNFADRSFHLVVNC